MDRLCPVPVTAPARLTVPVLIDGWQLECCGDPPGVGDRVKWRLEWSPHLTDLFSPVDVEPVRLAAAITAPSRPDAPSDCSAPVRVGGLSVVVTVPAPMPDPVLITGVLQEEHHVDPWPGAPRTTGTITRVRLVSWEYASDGDRSWAEVDGTARFTDEFRAPKRLHHGPPAPGALRWRRTTSVLVDLEVAG